MVNLIYIVYKLQYIVDFSILPVCQLLKNQNGDVYFNFLNNYGARTLGVFHYHCRSTPLPPILPGIKPIVVKIQIQRTRI